MSIWPRPMQREQKLGADGRAALGDEAAESGSAHAEGAARGSESILGHPIIERWPA